MRRLVLVLVKGMCGIGADYSAGGVWRVITVTLACGIGSSRTKAFFLCGNSGGRGVEKRSGRGLRV